MTDLPKSINQNGIHYSLIGDYYLPDWRDPDSHGSYGKWADLHLEYMKENQKNTWLQMLMADELTDYLNVFNTQAEERYQCIVTQLKSTEGITESLKAADQMEWLRRMNHIHLQAEKMVLIELVYE